MKATHDTMVQNRFEAMRFNISEACQSKSVYQVIPTFGFIKDRNLWYDSKNNFIYCMVEKIGSKFWRRVFHLLNHPEYRDLYSIPSYLVRNDELPTLRNFSIQNSTKIINSANKAMFVREPYARAFSGYVDKLYSLNYYYMQALGRGIIKALRKNATAASLACGHDLTFTEFIRYIVGMKQRNLHGRIDVHFSQIYTHCLPCELNYDFVGTMENFDEDASFLISKLQLFKNTPVELSQNASVTLSIYLVLNDTFSLRQKMAHCMPQREMISRAWRTLQMRGLINPEAPVPTQRNVTIDTLYREAVKVSEPSRVSEYRRKSLIETYGTLNEQLLEKFREYVLPDCKLFGYDDRPSFLFNRWR
ncbi:carbohydrate sulfotransferase 11-like [Pecten maximus]|uniref:carbohydrate sulfotransferase 11-like n=1 Tax=Pecten maximus TaxID=6579 RepID=UPI001458075A|nr:carbohydrate sulfotransferase 11-like [Pecten maximus]XP_033742608.1 carbohydrate sulfotransferase 11-like [Pecten maximus]